MSISISITEIKRVVYQTNTSIHALPGAHCLRRRRGREIKKEKGRHVCTQKYNPRHARHNRNMCLRATRGKQTSGSPGRQSRRKRGIMSHILETPSEVPASPALCPHVCSCSLRSPLLGTFSFEGKTGFKFRLMCRDFQGRHEIGTIRAYFVLSFMLCRIYAECTSGTYSGAISNRMIGSLAYIVQTTH